MARVKVLLFAVVALGLVYWAVSTSGGATAAAAQQADGQLGQLQQGVIAAAQAQEAHQRAVAAELTHDTALVAALADAAAKGGPTVDDAPALKAALEQALAKLPEGDRAYAAAAMATDKGAVAIVPGHDALSATSFAWLDGAAAAGGAGLLADVAGKKVQVFAAPVRAVKSDKVEQLGTVAVAYARDASAYAKLAEQFGGLTVAAGGKVLATSDKAHAAEAAKLAAGSKALVTGQPEKFVLSLPMPAATLVQARAFKLPGADGVMAIATADLSGVASATAAGQKAGLIAIIAIFVGGVLLALTMGGEKAPAAELAPQPSAAQPAAEATQAEPAFQPEATQPAAAAPAAFEDKPLVFNAPPPEPEPVQVAAAPEPAPGAVPGFDELFGPAPTASAPPPMPRPPAPPRSSELETRAAVPVPPSTPVVAVPPSSPPPMPRGTVMGDGERTGVMSRDMLHDLAAQSGAIPLPPTTPPSTPNTARAPTPGAEPEQQERTMVAAIPPELLRAAARAAPAAAANPEEQHFQEIYREFLQTRERCGEPPENLSFEKFAAKLRKNKEQLVQKYACKSVRFQVYVKEGKAALKATPVKEA